MKIGSLEVRNTKNLIGPATRLCALVYAPAKYGKTEFAAGLDALTQKYRGKPTLIIACEVAEGGGTMSVADRGIDYVMPQSYQDMESLIATLQTDTTYGGIILDNVTDYALRIVKPYALKFPSKERDSGTRATGVPMRGDYQVMGEAARQQLNKLVNLTNDNTPERYRKDLIVTALEREQSDEGGILQAIKPALPGALSDVASAMFQSVVSIKIKPKIVPNGVGGTRKLSGRILHVNADGIRVGDDRTGIFIQDYPLTDDGGKPQGLLQMYEEFLAKQSQPTAAG